MSYGRLREACQTDVDGTSIDVIEDVANQLGIGAEQTIVPVDHLLLDESDLLPAILVVRPAGESAHFVVAWRRHGPFVQIMDPATGRRWLPISDLQDLTEIHNMTIAASDWREWASSDVFLAGLRVRLKRLDVGTLGESLIESAVRDPSWRSFSALDAATRLTDALVRTRAIDGGREAARFLTATVEKVASELEGGALQTSIPPPYWSAAPAAPEDGEERVLLNGAVLIKVRPRLLTDQESPAPEISSPELVAALTEPPVRPLRELARLLGEDGLLTPALLVGALVVATLGVGLEALVLRGLLDVGRHLATWEQRLVAMGLLAVFVLSLLGLESSLVASTLRMGRRLETRLRVAFLTKIPRLSDRYFHSRPHSDMTHRAHTIHFLRQLPALGVRLLRSAAELLVTVAGLIWLDPSSAPIILGAAGVSVAIPCMSQSLLTERDLRMRVHHGALGRFYLDALLGLLPIRTHGAADRSLRREHETMIGEFRRAFLGLLGPSVVVDAIDATLGAAVAVWLLIHYLGTGRDPTAALMLIYWALNVPTIGHEIAQSMRQYPMYRNLTLRSLEPLGAIESDPQEGSSSEQVAATAATAQGVALQFDSVSVRAAGNTILKGVNLAIAPGEHVAVVGASGAGKSSLVGLLLGWHRVAEGQILVDGAPLAGERLDRLRLETAWVDPAVQLWNRSLLQNIEYGAPQNHVEFAQVLDAAEVVRVLEHLPQGLATLLGDGGALVSGGEGQLIRLARAMLRPESRLVILDEPFRGLDRERRRALLQRARALWTDVTLLCITHDVQDTVDFPRVIVLDDGAVVEDDAPQRLADGTGSQYRGLLDAERMVAHDLWRHQSWRRFTIRDGQLRVVEQDKGGPA